MIGASNNCAAWRNFTWWPGVKDKNDGRAEAALIAVAGMMRKGGAK
jgi:hypothetical protein